MDSAHIEHKNMGGSAGKDLNNVIKFKVYF